MTEATYLFGLDRGETICLLLGFGSATWSILFALWAEHAIKHLRQKWGR